MPLPLPKPPAVTVIQVALLTAVHEQLGIVITPTLPGPPAAAALADGAEMLQEHGAAAWLTVKVSSPMVIVPVCAEVPVLASTV